MVSYYEFTGITKKLILVLFTYYFEAVHFYVILILKLHNKNLVIKLHLLFVISTFDLYTALCRCHDTLHLSIKGPAPIALGDKITQLVRCRTSNQ